MAEKTIEIEVEKLQKLVDNFYEVCALCDEMNIYEFPEGDESMQEMERWVNENFGRTIQ